MPTILVVDDMAVYREPIEAALTAAGYHTTTAASGQQAVSILSATAPDLVLLDLTMPGMDGLAVLAHMRREPRLNRVPVLVLSAESDRTLVLEAGRLGVSGYILKAQFSLKHLLERIAHHLDSKPPLAPTRRPSAVPVPEKTASQTSIGDHQGQLAESLRLLAPISSRIEVEAMLRARCELKGFSPTVAQILKLSGNSRASVESIAGAIAKDHAVALKILKMANSAVYTRGSPVDSVQKAVVRIGIDRIRQAVLNIAVVEQFSAVAFDEELRTEHFWEHSIACGMIAAEIAHELAPDEADSAFTAGLVHDVGRVVLAEHLGERYVEVLRAARRLHAPLEQVESRMLQVGHAEIIETVLRFWHFPKDLVTPVALHHLTTGGMRSAAPRQLAESIRLGLANRLAHALLIGSSGNDMVYPTGEMCAALGIEPPAIQRIVANARTQTDDVKLAMLSCSSAASWPDVAEMYRARLAASFRPLFVSKTPELDAYAILCATLAAAGGDEAPNVAVIHASHATEHPHLEVMLLAAEEAAGVRQLPLLVLAPNGLPTHRLQDRPSLSLRTPVGVDRFLTAVNELMRGSELRAAA